MQAWKYQKNASRISPMQNVACDQSTRGRPEGRENVDDEGRRIWFRGRNRRECKAHTELFDLYAYRNSSRSRALVPKRMHRRRRTCMCITVCKREMRGGRGEGGGREMWESEGRVVWVRPRGAKRVFTEGSLITRRRLCPHTSTSVSGARYEGTHIHTHVCT